MEFQDLVRRRYTFCAKGLHHGAVIRPFCAKRTPMRLKWEKGGPSGTR